MSKHTPGPWQVNHSDPTQVCDTDGEQRGCAPLALAVGETIKERTANARLIAAAPDLLEALQELLEAEVLGFDLVPPQIKARDAIAKATQ